MMTLKGMGMASGTISMCIRLTTNDLRSQLLSAKDWKHKNVTYLPGKVPDSVQVENYCVHNENQSDFYC